MSKAILVIDMPSSCIDCPLHYYGEPILWCGANERDMDTDDIENYKPTWCPLREVPQKDTYQYADSYKYGQGRKRGRNECIDEILGGAENG